MRQRTVRWSLQSQLPIAAALLLTMLAAALTVVAVAEVRTQARLLAAARLESAAAQLAGSFAVALPRALERMAALSAQPAVLAMLTGERDTAAARRVLAPLAGNDAHVTVILWDSAARPVLVAAVRGDSTGWVGPPTVVQSPSVTSVLRLSDSMLVYDLVAPVRRSGLAAGYIQRRARIYTTADGDQSRTALVGDSGRLLIGSADGAWSDLHRATAAPPPEAIGSGTATVYQRDGARMLGVGRAVAGTPWIIFAEMPLSAALRLTSGFLGRLGMIALTMVLATTAAAALLGRGITGPLRSLRDAAAAMAGGRTDARASVGGHPELASVAATFNLMADATAEHVTAVEASEQRFRSLVTASAQIVWWTDAAGHFNEAQPLWQVFTGQSLDEARGSGWTDAIHQDDAPRARQAWREAIEHRSIFEAEYRIRRHDGVYRLFLTRGVPVMNEAGTISEWVSTATDITRRREIEDSLQRKEAELQQALRLDAIGRLAGGVAHDFNNLLTAIVLPVEQATDKLPAGHPARDDLDEIREAGARAADLTRQLLAFGRQQLLTPELISVDEVVESAGRLLKRVIPESVRLELALRSASARVKVDRGQLEQVIVNLAVNARDAMPTGGRLTIESSRVELTNEVSERHGEVEPGSYVMLAVTDTGSGMDEATRAQVFEPFFTTKQQGKGTGLGLSTVYGIVRQSGGYIWVYSEPGKGTVVKAYFPEAQGEQPAAAAPGSPATIPRGTGTILFAEDDAALRRIGERVLKSLGYTVMSAPNGDTALMLAAAFDGTIDLLVTDVVMPGINGMELWEQLRRLRPGIPALFLSGWASDAVVRHRILEGQVPFVQKPFSTEQLGRKVHELIYGDRKPGADADKE